jgi:dihydroorotate dehydrogenase electron transfer subunit
MAKELSDKKAQDAYLAACGPMEMLRAVADLAKSRGLDLEVSLESRMACGLGACLGCTVFLFGGEGRRVCCDGPVFTAREVFGP